MVAIDLRVLWLISKTTNRPTTSEFLQLFRTSAKFFQSAFFVILCPAFRDAPHSPCLAVASLIAFRLIRRLHRSWLRRLRPVEDRFDKHEELQVLFARKPRSGSLGKYTLRRA
jgi:hypothetical protein